MVLLCVNVVHCTIPICGDAQAGISHTRQITTGSFPTVYSNAFSTANKVDGYVALADEKVATNGSAFTPFKAAKCYSDSPTN